MYMARRTGLKEAMGTLRRSRSSSRLRRGVPTPSSKVRRQQDTKAGEGAKPGTGRGEALGEAWEELGAGPKLGWREGRGEDAGRPLGGA